MSPLIIPPSNTTPADEDLAEQAVPGHGIPSQDTDPAAQIALEPEEAEREVQSVLMGGGMVAGALWGSWSEPLWVPLPAHWAGLPLAMANPEDAFWYLGFVQHWVPALTCRWPDRVWACRLTAALS